MNISKYIQKLDQDRKKTWNLRRVSILENIQQSQCYLCSMSITCVCDVGKLGPVGSSFMLNCSSYKCAHTRSFIHASTGKQKAANIQVVNKIVFCGLSKSIKQRGREALWSDYCIRKGAAATTKTKRRGLKKFQGLYYKAFLESWVYQT